MMQMIERAMDHDGFSVLEVLSECVEFSRAHSMPAIRERRRSPSSEEKVDNTPDEARHDVTDEITNTGSPMSRSGPFRRVLRIDRPTKNSLESDGLPSHGQSSAAPVIWRFCRRRSID
jgi:2-oxoglutarate ferredoxin oxidoreductase subunit beta